MTLRSSRCARHEQTLHDNALSSTCGRSLVNGCTTGYYRSAYLYMTAWRLACSTVGHDEKRLDTSNAAQSGLGSQTYAGRLGSAVCHRPGCEPCCCQAVPHTSSRKENGGCARRIRE